MLSKLELKHNKSLWIVPTLLTTLIFILIFYYYFTNQTDHSWLFNIRSNDELINPINGITGFYSAFYSMSFVVVLGLTQSLLFFYGLNALSRDYHNKSIYFWKSLPVSDKEYITAKTLTFISILVFTTLLLLILRLSLFVFPWLLNYDSNPQVASIISESLNISAFLLPTLKMLLITICCMLPYFGWGLLISVSFPSSPILIGFLAPPALYLIQHIFTRHSFIGQSFFNFFEIISNWIYLIFSYGQQSFYSSEILSNMTINSKSLPLIDEKFYINLFVYLLVGVGLIFIASYMRQKRSLSI
ncbi:MAG: hypothetical protein JWM09_924 [Francisellaceae bacterium]|nr:hypothetical protein [Francisellaceae bacterium]